MKIIPDARFVTIRNGQSRETGNIGNKTKKNKNTTQHVLDTTMRNQTQIT
jgi:hypothetical protein